MRADYHCHSYFSDGALAPSELVIRAAEQGLQQLAITDHDSVAGLEQAQQTIATQQLALTLIAGVEISCRWHSFEIHIVGLNINPQAADLAQLLTQQQQCRRQRFAAMVEKLQSRLQGFVVELPQQQTMPTRKHLADALLSQGYVSEFGQAFKRYLGQGQCAYVKPEWCSVADAIAAINASGGVAVLAHPHAYQMSNKWLRRLIVEAQQHGLAAIEVSQTQQSPGQREALAGFAKDYQLSASVGSDFHYPSRFRELGKNLCLPEGCVPIWHHWQGSKEH
ncbi:PHP domain-containing protein [Idiomarina tyrosinivorans]|uniref:PHP domain-containing protein n=1 Tax=Idiomarina tyrosinivorans TaxID=1445662 RepID=A0A432ZLK6_9GAMM|nr:PHP domain-containing protein [Idiomarina tyrosinivorans]RUO78848.1 PHP domain-containing protein [Idiomarina tyrosinivorans]